MKLYGISGLGADKRVFKYLSLNCEFIPIDWLIPKEKERIDEYAIRLAQSINTEEPFGILGVSFGGLVAVEISKKLNPNLTILISSVETKNELRTIYRLAGKTGLLTLLPQKIFDPPRFIANWVFGTKEKLLHQILDDTDLYFAKWAVTELANWENSEPLKNRVLKIMGTTDKLIPPKSLENTKLINKGAHFMVVDKAEEINQIINEELKLSNL